MIGSTRQVRVFAPDRPADMRKGYNGLSALVTQELRRDLLSGDVFLFVCRDRKRSKALFWDGTGLCIHAKRLEQGRFTAPWFDDPTARSQLTISELALFLEGSKLAGKVRLTAAGPCPDRESVILFVHGTSVSEPVKLSETAVALDY